MTGKEAAWGHSQHRGALLAVEEANAAGGLLGRKIELLLEDNQSKPGETTTAARKLISRDKVVGLIGEIAMGAASRVRPEAISPMSPTTLSLDINLRAAVVVSPGFDWLSSRRSSIFRPSRPPAALASSTASSAPRCCECPHAASLPVMEAYSPIRIGSGLETLWPRTLTARAKTANIPAAKPGPERRDFDKITGRRFLGTQAGHF